MDLVFAPSQIETQPIALLCPYARNAKVHGDDQVAKIAGLLAEDLDLTLLGISDDDLDALLRDRSRPCSRWRWSKPCWMPSSISATWCSNPSAAQAPN